MFALLAFAGVRAQSEDPTDPSYWDEDKLAAYDQAIANQHDDVIYMKSSMFPAGSGVVELPINVKCHAPFINVQFRTVLPEANSVLLYPQDEKDLAGEMKVVIVGTSRISADAVDGKNFTDERYTQYVTSKQGFCSGDDDVFFSVKVDISNLEAGVYDLTVKSGAILSGFAPDDANGRREVNEPIVTKLVITDEIVLDENDTDYPGTYSGVDVRVKRTFAFDVWNTLCLPINMDEAQCKAVFGNNVDIAEFNGYEYEAADKYINVKFNHVTSIKANTPLIIKIQKSDFTDVDEFKEFKLENVDIVTTAANTLRTRVGKGMMIGTYTNGTTLYKETEDELGDPVITQYIFLNNNKFYYATDKTHPLKGFRAYFYFQDDAKTALSDGVKFNFSVNNDEPTSIDGISSIEKIAEGVYNVSGQKVSDSSLEGLPKGVYIVNGKKVFKK